MHSKTITKTLFLGLVASAFLASCASDDKYIPTGASTASRGEHMAKIVDVDYRPAPGQYVNLLPVASDQDTQASINQRIFASPHVTDCTFENTEETLATPLSELNEALQKDGFSIQRHAEYRVDDFFAKQMHDGKLKVLPNNYILIEHSFLQEPFDIEGTVYELKRRGFNPILAHPERYKYYYGNKERYRQLHDLGLYFQVNLLSLADHYKGEAKAVAEWLIDHNLVDFIGTDIHRHEHIDAIEHYLMTPDAEKHFKALQGKLLNDTL